MKRSPRSSEERGLAGASPWANRGPRLAASAMAIGQETMRVSFIHLFKHTQEAPQYSRFLLLLGRVGRPGPIHRDRLPDRGPARRGGRRRSIGPRARDNWPRIGWRSERRRRRRAGG